MAVSGCSGELATAEQRNSGGVVRAIVMVDDDGTNEMEGRGVAAGDGDGSVSRG